MMYNTLEYINIINNDQLMLLGAQIENKTINMKNIYVIDSRHLIFTNWTYNYHQSKGTLIKRQ